MKDLWNVIKGHLSEIEEETARDEEYLYKKQLQLIMSSGKKPVMTKAFYRELIEGKINLN